MKTKSLKSRKQASEICLRRSHSSGRSPVPGDRRTGDKVGKISIPAFVGGFRESQPTTAKLTHPLTPIHCPLFLGNTTYHEFTEQDGEPVVRYARAQVMKDSCVTCHNESKESPKRDWKPGELAGVLEITRPLEQDIQRTRTGLRGTFVLMSSVAVMLVGVSFALLLGTRRRKGVKD